MPLVSVVIVNWNGRGVVEPCLRRVLQLDWPRLEVLVVDNASSDGSPAAIREEFGGRVRLMGRSENSVTAARNEGFRAAAGEYIVSLDNDILLPDSLLVRRAVALFEARPEVSALAFKIGSVEQPHCPLRAHWWHPVPLRRGGGRFFYTCYFGEGGVAFRRTALAATGGYDEMFHQGHEGPELALRMLAAGGEILYCPNLVCAEQRVPDALPGARRRIKARSLRNKLWMAWKSYPLSRAVPYAAGRLAVAGVRAARYGWLNLWWQSAREGVLAPAEIRRQRRPLPPALWNRLHRIRQGDFPALTMAGGTGPGTPQQPFLQEYESYDLP